MADFPVAFFEAVADSNALVKDEAIAFPFAVFFVDGFEIFQNAAFKVVDVFKPMGEHVAGCFFAADAACAEHGDFFIFGRVEVFFDPIGEFGEDFHVGIDCAFEDADFCFVIIASVDEDDIGIVD